MVASTRSRKSVSVPRPSRTVLGIEAGGTRTVALLAAADNRALARFETGPANLRLLTDTELRASLRQIAQRFPGPGAIGIGMAGAREESDRRRIRAAAAVAWPGVPCWVGNDLETALAAAEALASPAPAARVIVISGTGSCCYGRNAAGKTAKVGGWGHLLGDQGSGYDIALGALRAVVGGYDRNGAWPRLGQRCLRALQLNEPNDLVTWLHAANKGEVAALAVEIFAAARAGDRLAAAIIERAADTLADHAAACARRLVRPTTRVECFGTGGTFRHQPRFLRAVADRLQARWPGASFKLLPREGVWGAVALARELASQRGGGGPGLATPIPLPAATAASPTEQRNPRSTHLDRMPLGAAIRLMLSEDAKLPRALRAEQVHIERAVRLVTAAFRRGGRLFYVGAGTSGRLGVLDASECPPTFSVPPEWVQGIVAGGHAALWSSLEGAEDDAEAGRRALEFRGVTRRDVVVGIAASGRTPFVWGTLQAARQAGAKTVLICFNPNLQFPRGTRPAVVLAPRIGPEVLTGSTRLKAGTATKLLLNLLTTLAMVRMGKVVGNLMVDLRPSNVKLRDRAVRIVRTLTGADAGQATAALERSAWVVKRALASLRPSRSRTLIPGRKIAAGIPGRAAHK